MFVQERHFEKLLPYLLKINHSYFFEKQNKIWKEIKELMRINFEAKPLFSNNITCRTKIKTLLSDSVDYQDIKLPRK